MTVSYAWKLASDSVHSIERQRTSTSQLHGARRLVANDQLPSPGPFDLLLNEHLVNSVSADEVRPYDDPRPCTTTPYGRKAVTCKVGARDRGRAHNEGQTHNCHLMMDTNSRRIAASGQGQ